MGSGLTGFRVKGLICFRLGLGVVYANLGTLSDLGGLGAFRGLGCLVHSRDLKASTPLAMFGSFLKL